jgi:hypothetical protein
MMEGQKAIRKISAILRNILTNISSEMILPSGRDTRLFLTDTDSKHAAKGVKQGQKCKRTHTKQ